MKYNSASLLSRDETDHLGSHQPGPALLLAAGTLATFGERGHWGRGLGHLCGIGSQRGCV